MNPAVLCELDDLDEMRRAFERRVRAHVAVSHALVDAWEPAPMSALRRPPTPWLGDVPVTARQIASGSPDRQTTAVRRDRRLAGAVALVLAPLFPLLARGGWT